MGLSVRTKLFGVLVAGIIAIGATVSAQAIDPNDTGPSIDRRVKGEIIDSLCEALNTYYVFPDVAAKMEEHARKQLKKGAYDTLNTTAVFARALTEDLRTVCHDRHFSMSYAPKDLLIARLDTVNRPTYEEELNEARFRNFGFHEAKRLPGNIGYLKFNQFSWLPEARETAVAAMNFLGNCDAIIFDLRENGGGDPKMIGLITSYLFDESVHLNTFYIRETDSLKQFWTSEFVDGRRMSKTPAFVLTSAYSFSGAEEFTYNLKNLKRATIVGETTGGGAHPVDEHMFPNLQIVARVPYGRAINPITGTNWEGTGVEPDIKCPADKALDVARLEAMKKVREAQTDQRRLAQYDWDIATLQALVNPVVLSENQMLAYVGDFGPRKVTLENGSLFYQREQNPKHRMTPMGNDQFCFENIPYFRLKFIAGDPGNFVAVEGHYDNGHVDRNEKTN